MEYYTAKGKRQREEKAAAAAASSASLLSTDIMPMDFQPMSLKFDDTNYGQFDNLQNYSTQNTQHPLTMATPTSLENNKYYQPLNMYMKENGMLSPLKRSGHLKPSSTYQPTNQSLNQMINISPLLVSANQSGGYLPTSSSYQQSNSSSGLLSQNNDYPLEQVVVATSSGKGPLKKRFKRKTDEFGNVAAAAAADKGMTTLDNDTIGTASSSSFIQTKDLDLASKPSSNTGCSVASTQLVGQVVANTKVGRNGVTDWQCPLCSKQFTWQSQQCASACMSNHMRKTHRVTLPSKQKTKVVKKKASTTAKAKKKKQQPAKPKQHPRKKEKASAPSARANRMQLKNAAAPDAKSILEEKKQILNHRRKLLAYVRMSRTAAEERVNNLSDEECKQLEAVADPLEGTPKTDDASLEEPTTQNPQSSTVGLDASSSTNVELTTTKRPEELTKNEKHLKHQAALQNAATSKAKKKKTKKKKEKKTSTNRGITQRPSGKWQAQIFYAGKSRYLGVYDTEQAAALSFERASAFLQNIPETKNKVVIEHNVKLARNAAKTIGAL